jgi:hypothetical protein
MDLTGQLDASAALLPEKGLSIPIAGWVLFGPIWLRQTIEIHLLPPEIE